MSKGIIPRGINSSSITLVPKIPAPMKIIQYMLISLINCSLKLLSTILPHRLELVIHKVVSESQYGFIKGRQIFEGIIVVNELEDAMRRGKIKGIILKLDSNKTFDYVD